MEKKNNLDPQYNDLVRDILKNGTKKQTRNGEVISIFGRQIRHSMSHGFPLLTGKKMFFKGIVTELLWFLRGDTNIKFLLDNDCHIWDGDAYKNFKSRFSQMPGIQSSLPTKEEFIDKIKNQDGYAELWGELGPIYGKQWRQWQGWMKCSNGTMGSLWYDQIARLVHSLKTEPDSRRLMVSAWNVGELDQMVLPPCHYGFQVYTRELSVKERMEIYFKQHPDWAMIGEHSFFDKHNIPTRAISLMFNMRSNDVPLGLPFNLASYGLLLEILGRMVNMIPDELIGNLGDCHIYENQIDGIKEQLTREPFELPTLYINTEFWPTEGGECGIGPLTPNINHLISEMQIGDFQIENYQSHPTIKIPLSN